MSTAWMLYWFTRLDAINGLWITAALICAASAAFAFAAYLDNRRIGRKTWRALIPAACLFAALFVLTPTQKDAAIIAGGQLAVNVAQTPEARELGSKVLQVINKELDERISKKDSE